jgi:hypothetical protein
MPVEEALEKKYKAPLRRIVPAYGASLGVKGAKYVE